jgi:ribonuclease HI
MNEKERKDDLRAQIAHHGEKLGGIWSAINKEKKPRDLIRRLRTPNSDPPQYERSTTRMAKLARTYHQTLQYDSDPPPTDKERKQQIQTPLEAIPAEQSLENPETTEMNELLDEASVKKALDQTKNGTATGLDGCPYELWKTLKKRHDDDVIAGKQGFDIIRVLTQVYQDIQKNGLDAESNFAQGWMCLLYKKKDPTEICNYRPITLLNTDYKILTKALATQLMDKIEHLVHPDQAGFIRNRSIFNQTRLARTIIDYAEVTHENGAIVALDQEKAYDKIKHDYLWATMEKFEIPHTFIETVRTLYSNANTMVAINGIFSDPYKVTRGIRQGDPLSCALFDLAIELLACRLCSDPRLQGYKIPGTEDKLITSLFADDTNIYLSENDSMDDVQIILDEWCQASGAKFNIGKTEIIPMGTPEHRNQVITSQKLNPQDQTRFDDRIRIANDGEATRSLGAWIGNNTNDAAPWEPIIDKAHKCLALWNKSHPTLLGRKLIAQMIIGGLTQFLTMAQGMPKRIESVLTKMIRNFMWNDSSIPKIALETLYRPVEDGGLNLLDLNVRNEAIEIMWLKTYLTSSAPRPTWARITDILIDAAAPKETNQKARMNTFLQTWKPHSRGIRAKLRNDDIIRMLKVGRKYNLTFSAIRLSPRLKEQLPAWYHPGTEQRQTKIQTTRCLIEVHDVLAIADLIRISRRLQNPPLPRPHTPSAWCICSECILDQIKKCKNPHECAFEAQTKMNALYPKYNPQILDENHGNLSLTASRKRKNLQAKYQNELITFDPSITSKTSLTDCFHIFTDPNTASKLPAQRGIDPSAELRHHKIKVYTDGACSNNGKTNARCGSGIWIAPDDPRNQAIRVPGKEQSNQIGELVAVIKTAQDLPPFAPLEIHSDSMYVINGLTSHLPNWENIGWIEVQNAPLFKRAAFLLRRQTAITQFKWIKGHSGDRGNEESDRLAREGASKAEPDDLELQTPAEFDIQGAKLSALSQALAYRGIRKMKMKKSPPTVPNLLQKIRVAIRNFNGQRETNATIWKSFRKPVLRTRVQQFFYKSVHQALMVGDVWNHIPNYEYRETCQTCNTTETMEHILTQCTARPNHVIWNLARRTCPHRDTLWPEINIGLILGIGCLNSSSDDNPQEQIERNPRTAAIRKGRTCLLQILVSESAHLIWVLRCERIIHEDNHTDEEIKARWLRKVNERLTCDRIAATKIERNKTYTNLIKNTWKKTLQKYHDLPVNWIHNREVLVGSGR